MTPARFTHSEICGSKTVCVSSQLIAAYHVLHRLPVPRHPPCALNIFILFRHQVSICNIAYPLLFAIVSCHTIQLSRCRQSRNPPGGGSPRAIEHSESWILDAISCVYPSEELFPKSGSGLYRNELSTTGVECSP